MSNSVIYWKGAIQPPHDWANTNTGYAENILRRSTDWGDQGQARGGSTSATTVVPKPFASAGTVYRFAEDLNRNMHGWKVEDNRHTDSTDGLIALLSGYVHEQSSMDHVGIVRRGWPSTSAGAGSRYAIYSISEGEWTSKNAIMYLSCDSSVLGNGWIRLWVYGPCNQINAEEFDFVCYNGSTPADNSALFYDGLGRHAYFCSPQIEMRQSGLTHEEYRPSKYTPTNANNYPASVHDQPSDSPAPKKKILRDSLTPGNYILGFKGAAQPAAPSTGIQFVGGIVKGLVRNLVNLLTK